MNVRLSHRSSVFAVFPAIVLIPAISSGATLLDDQFSDTDRTNQALPSSSAWYYGSTAAGGGASAATSALALTNTAANNLQTWAYFTNSGLQNLAVGDSLSATFTFTINAPGTGGTITAGPALRFGFFDSTTRVIADKNGSIADTNWNTIDGYSAWVNANSSSTTTTSVIRQRDLTNTTMWANAAHTTLTGTATPNTAVTLATGTTYTMSFQMTLTNAATMTLASSVDNGATNVLTMSATDTSTLTTGFDTFSVFSGTQVSEDYTLDDVLITFTPVPEPASLLMGVAGAGLLIGRRRR